MYNNYDLHIKILLNIILINMFLLYDLLIQSILFNKFTFPLTRYCINSGLYTLSEFEIAAIGPDCPENSCLLHSGHGEVSINFALLC